MRGSHITLDGYASGSVLGRIKGQSTLAIVITIVESTPPDT